MSYKKCSLTADIVCTFEDKEILLIQRKNDPFKGSLSLPGGFVDLNHNECIEDAAYRELFEETNIRDVQIYSMKYLKYFDAPFRDKRARVVSHLFHAKLKDKTSISFLDKLGGSLYIKNVSNQYLTWSNNKLEPIQAGDDASCLLWARLDMVDKLQLAFDHERMINYYLNHKGE